MKIQYNIVRQSVRLMRTGVYPSSTITTHEARARESVENIVMWDSLEVARGYHTFLRKNKITTGFGARVLKSNLVISFRNRSGSMALLFVPQNGKPYFKGELNGGVAVTQEGKPEFIAVDYISAASISQMTYKPCIIAGTPENLEKVAALFPDLTIIVCNAKQSEEYKSAQRCSELYGNHVFTVPEIESGVVTVNDYMRTGANICRSLGIDEHLPRFRFMGNVLKNPVPVSWLIHGLIRSQASVMMVFAPSHSGKTYVILDMMLKICYGYPDWFGLKIHHGHVLYLCGEGSSDVQERILLWLQENRKSVGSLADRFSIMDGTVDLDDEEDVTNLIDDIKTDLYGITPKLIAIDTMSLYMSGDENSTSDSNRLIRNLKRIARAFDCCIVLIHHTSKSNEDVARGNGAIKAALDSEILVKGSDGKIDIKQTKNRAMNLIPVISLELEEHEILRMIDKDTGEPKRNAILVRSKEDSEEEQPEFVKRTKLDDDKDFLISACMNYGQIDTSTREITIDRDDLAKEGSSTWNMTVGDAKKAKLNPKQEHKPLWRLLNKGILEETEQELYRVIDDSVINSILAGHAQHHGDSDEFEDNSETDS